MKECKEEKIQKTEELKVEEVNVFAICTSESRKCLYDCYPFHNALITTDH